MTMERIDKARLAKRLVESQRRLAAFEEDPVKNDFLVEMEKNTLRRILERLPEDEETFGLISQSARYVEAYDARKGALDQSELGRLVNRVMKLNMAADGTVSSKPENISLGSKDPVDEAEWEAFRNATMAGDLATATHALQALLLGALLDLVYCELPPTPTAAAIVGAMSAESE